MPGGAQDWIHKLEEGPGYRYLQRALGVIVVIGVATWYNLAEFRNLSTRQGMDAAQLGRRLAEGHGYTTQFIRPFSVYLMNRHAAQSLERAAAGGASAGTEAGQERRLRQAKLLEPHPDLANAPLYPVLLAGLLKVMPFEYPDVTRTQSFSTYLPDLWIAFFNQALLLAAVVMVFRLARRLFDESVAWVSAAVLVGTAAFWRLSTSGLPTVLLTVIFVGLVGLLAKLEGASRNEAPRSSRWWTAAAAAAGLLVGLGALTRYSFGWLIVPLGLALATLPGPNRGRLTPVAVGVFLAVTLPWVIRNYTLSGTPFGTAGFAMFQETPYFTGDQLERSLQPDLTIVSVSQVFDKVLMNLREALDVPRLGGSWVSAFFLVGLLVPFRNPVLGRLRWFVLGCLATLAVAQAAGRTGGSLPGSDVHGDNLVLATAPMAFMFGVGLFFVLLDTVGINFPAARYGVIGGFCLLASAPLVLALVAPSRGAPAYYPPWIQEKASYMAEDDLIMSDVPWAVAWYGHRQSIWLSLKYREDPSKRLRNDFETTYRAVKPVKALYLSFQALKSVPMESLWDWVLREGEQTGWESYVKDWEAFLAVGAFLHREVPSGFPLKQAPMKHLLPELFLTDSERPAGK